MRLSCQKCNRGKCLHSIPRGIHGLIDCKLNSIAPGLRDVKNSVCIVAVASIVNNWAQFDLNGLGLNIFTCASHAIKSYPP